MRASSLRSRKGRRKRSIGATVRAKRSSLNWRRRRRGKRSRIRLIRKTVYVEEEELKYEDEQLEQQTKKQDEL